MNEARRLYAAVALLSTVQLGFEMMVIKLVRYELGSLSIGTIGLAILGVSLAGPATRLLGGRQKAPARAVWALLPAVVLAGAFFFSLAHQWVDGETAYLRVAECGLAALVVLALASVPVLEGLRRDPARVGAVYAASLLGATLGAPAMLGTMQIAQDVGAYAIVVLACGLGGMFVFRSIPARAACAGAAVLLAGLAVVWYPALDRRAHPDAIATRTDALSRIDVYGRSRGRLRFRTAGIAAGTTSAGGTVDAPPRGLLKDLSAAAFEEHPRRVLVLGSGAGRNVVQALALGAREVVAVEINPMIPRAMRSLLARDEDPYRDPRVRLEVGEAREITTRMARPGGPRFDLVYVPVATLFGSSGHTFTETYLMTREAFELYGSVLAQGGLAAVFYVDVGRAKVLSAMAGALERRGVADPRAHMAIAGRRSDFVAIARFDAPIDARERERLSRRGTAEIDLGAELREARGLRALTDDNPFLYNDMWSASGERAAFGWNLRFLRQAYLAALAALAACLAFILVRSPRERRAPRAGLMTAFILMGIAYTALQTVILQRLAFMVGHPVLATAIVLPMTLLGSALGAWLVARLPEARYGRWRVAGFAAIVVFCLPFAALAPESLVLAGIPQALRIALAAVLAALPFVPLGTYFPAAFGRIGRHDGDLAPAAWLVNGIGAVIGSVVSIYASMLLGFSVTVVVTIVAYAMLSAWDVASASNPASAPTGRRFLAIAAAGVAILTLVLEISTRGIAP
jgi:hypothetical protein